MKKVNWYLILVYVYGGLVVLSALSLLGVWVKEMIEVGVQPIYYYPIMVGLLTPFIFLYWLFALIFVESLEEAKSNK